MFKNEVIVSEYDKKQALYHIQEVNKILDKYPYSSCFANTATSISKAKTLSKDAEQWIEYLNTEIEEGK